MYIVVRVIRNGPVRVGGMALGVINVKRAYYVTGYIPATSHTSQNDYCNPRCACAPRVNYNNYTKSISQQILGCEVRGNVTA